MYSVPLAALILGSDDGIPADTIHVAGQGMLEYQARVARAAGAQHFVMIVDRMPAALVSAVDRLRADGINLETARTPGDAADRIHPDEDVIVLSSALMIDDYSLGMLASALAPAILTAGKDREMASAERIDSEHFWAGAILISGKLLRETAQKLGDWDFAPTLLRAALQAGAARMALPDGGVVALLTSQAQASAATKAIALRNIRVTETGWLGQISGAGVSHIAAWMLDRRVPLSVIGWLPVLTLAVAIAIAAWGWPAVALASLLVATGVAEFSKTALRIACRAPQSLHVFGVAARPASASIFALIGVSSYYHDKGWGALVLGAWAASAQIQTVQIWSWELATIAALLPCLFGQPLLGLGCAIMLHLVNMTVGLLRSP
jgi:hypothetical protein